MITAKELKVRIPDKFTSKYIEDELKKLGFDIIRWTITDSDNEFYTVNAAIVEN